MGWGRISANSRTSPIFVTTGVKINSKTYRELILDTEVKGFGCKNFENTRKQKIDFISKEEWPPSSPDLKL